MRVLIYTHEFPPFLGGLATASYKLVKGISQAGIKTVVLAPSYSSKDGEIDKILKCKIIRIPLLRKIKRLRYPGTLVGYLLGWTFFALTVFREKPDIVLFISEEAEVVGGLLPTFPFKPIVRVAGSGITTYFLGNQVRKKLLRLPMLRLYKKALVIAAASHFTKELLEKIDIPRDKITVIYNGVEKYMIHREPNRRKIEELRKKLGIGKEDKILLTVARILPRKGQDTVIRALPKVLSRYSRVKYIVVGEGKYKGNFKRLAKEIKISDNVIFTGGVPHEETINFYDLCDIFIMPNRFWNNKVEGLPNALLEASARGKPVIAGANGGSKEAVKHGITGFLVNPEDIEEIAGVILDLLENEKKARTMGENGKQMIRQIFTEEIMINNYVKILNDSTKKQTTPALDSFK
jgi:phosphatidylinositol alpha-1,6-mannosyltransferase